MQSTITVSGVSFEFPNGNALFQNLNFSLNKGLTALVGPNGVGKTSLAKMIVGDLEPTTGSLRRQAQVGYFSQREVPQEISIQEYLGREQEWSQLREDLLSGVDRGWTCSRLSGGQWVRVRLAKVLGDQFLILDEPSNDLDQQGRRVLLHFLREFRHGILLISHDRELLELCDQVLELSNRGLSVYGQGWQEYRESKAKEHSRLRENLDQAKNRREQGHKDRTEARDRQEKRNRRGAAEAARGGLPKILLGARKRRAQVTSGNGDAATMERAQAGVREAFEAYEQLKVDPVMYADLRGQTLPSQKLLAEAVDFNVRFQDWLYPKDLNFVWRGNLRLALTGPNGSGKTTLLKAILGEKFETTGVLRAGNLKTLYLDQGCAILNEQESILENIREVARMDESEIRNGLAKFLFTRDSVFQKISELSGGERLRAALAKGLLSTEKPELLILDEPTNNLDLENIEFLEGLVSQFSGALILISHDPEFRRNCGITEEFEFLAK